MDYFNLSSELAEAKSASYKSGGLKKFGKGARNEDFPVPTPVPPVYDIRAHTNPVEMMYGSVYTPFDKAQEQLKKEYVFPRNMAPVIPSTGNLNLRKAPQVGKSNELRDMQGNIIQTSLPVIAKGGMIKRADGSYSRRGLWDNIRANRGSGKKPTKEMLKQEKKIKGKYEEGGPIKSPVIKDYDRDEAPKEGNYLLPDINRPGYIDQSGNLRTEYRMGITDPKTGKEVLIPTVINGNQFSPDGAVQRYLNTGYHMGMYSTPDEANYASALRTKKYNVLQDAVKTSPTLSYGKGGYTVRKTSERKGKTHVVTAPDGTKKYFGDPSMGERSKSKYGKDAFYKRHAKSLKKNPYFRAYAKATWEDGGIIRDVEPFNLSSY